MWTSTDGRTWTSIGDPSFSEGAITRVVATASGLESATSATFTVTLSMADVDHDGFSPSTGDCNDGDAAIHPGATDNPDGANHTDENCDGIDGTSFE